ncbi:hypothetical protein [uncultured Eubacterium sp.]|uniref:hypothetical protein n=1 Tax=uncultured Eubacterium sp. TaxID=165185 RepID=UPI0025972325|nr:hypothetical protein [uncultured Eubacterium sp.]
MKDRIKCPVVDGMIEVGDCVIYSDVSSGMLKENCVPEYFKENKDWRDICKKCKYHKM